MLNIANEPMTFTGCEIIDFSDAALGLLQSPKGLPGDRKNFYSLGNNDKDEKIIDGAAIVNGVALPENVILQLHELGIPISWYSAAQLEDAVEACAYDDILIDDGNGLEDDFSFTSRKEQEKDKEAQDKAAREKAQRAQGRDAA